MLQRNKGYEILEKAGGITSVQQAKEIFKKYMDEKSLSRIEVFKNNDIILKIANAAAMCRPDKIFINTGSEEDREFIRQKAIENGEEKSLPMKGHTIHFDLPQEQGRIIDRTFYVVNPDENISSLAKKMLRDQAFSEVKEKMTGIMQGKTMIVGFYVRGPVNAAVSNPALEITSSAYVSHSAEILYRNAFSEFEKEVERANHFFTNIHSEGKNRPQDLPDARVFMDRSFWTTYSFNCTYAGNTLLLKKGNHRFAVDKAVYEDKGNELAEHMFITGINGPGERITWCAGAAPSGCGKTTTAMAGDHFVGDDLAQLWIDENGSIRSINPECGIFGIVEDVNQEGDPHLMDVLRKQGHEVIWSNVLIDENGVPQWTGNGEEPPLKGFNFQGRWEQGMTDKDGKPIPMSHPNARCTVSSKALANYCEAAEDPKGVETRIFTYSGRDSDTMPPVWVSKTYKEGVAIGACIVSAATATEVGASGVKRAPWANAPFIPGSLGDYMDAQFKFFGSEKIAKNKKPILAGLNYFLTHEARGGNSKKLLGEKKDVKVWLAWLERLANNEVNPISTPIGFIPQYQDLKKLFDSLIGKEYSHDLYLKQFSLYIDKILYRIDMQIDAYSKEDGIPAMFFEVLKKQKENLLELKEKSGDIVSPEDLI